MSTGIISYGVKAAGA